MVWETKTWKHTSCFFWLQKSCHHHNTMKLSTREENFPLSNFFCICDWGLNRIVSTISSGLFPIHLWNPPCFTTHVRRLQTLMLGLHGWIINIKQLVLACYLFIYGNPPALQHMLGDSKPYKQSVHVHGQNVSLPETAVTLQQPDVLDFVVVVVVAPMKHSSLHRLLCC